MSQAIQEVLSRTWFQLQVHPSKGISRGLAESVCSQKVLRIKSQNLEYEIHIDVKTVSVREVWELFEITL